MKGVNIIVVFNENSSKILMCKRKKDPFMGLCNFVGGKIENGESGTDAAYRELFEETGISRSDITLTHLMDFTYYCEKCLLEVYVGKLTHSVSVYGEENELFWEDINSNFFDIKRYAGKGNIGHLMEIIKEHQKELML